MAEQFSRISSCNIFRSDSVSSTIAKCTEKTSFRPFMPQIDHSRRGYDFSDRIWYCVNRKIGVNDIII